MKNIHLIPTDKPSRLFKFANQLHLDTIPKEYYKKYQIYITSDEEIKEGDWYVSTHETSINQCSGFNKETLNKAYWAKKIILTTDPDLIKDGIQKIDDTFLEWFVKNPSCEFVEVEPSEFLADKVIYEIIIPKEEPKQETLEEAAEKEFPLVDTKWCRTGAAEEENLQLLSHRKSFIKGAKWQAEKILKENKFKNRYDIGFYDGFKHAEKLLYSEEEVEEIFKQAQLCTVKADGVYFKYETFEQFKKK
jgi:hypothetical protein